mmetsp:Transcript_20382/g.58033  ORF Transcript_20382/g.58033 Transcript_20382/m.58033 type:complete len:620 (-) Transcript_20382:224-2083(-)
MQLRQRGDIEGRKGVMPRGSFRKAVAPHTSRFGVKAAALQPSAHQLLVGVELCAQRAQATRLQLGCIQHVDVPGRARGTLQRPEVPPCRRDGRVRVCKVQGPGAGLGDAGVDGDVPLLGVDAQPVLAAGRVLGAALLVRVLLHRLPRDGVVEARDVLEDGVGQDHVSERPGHAVAVPWAGPLRQPAALSVGVQPALQQLAEPLRIREGQERVDGPVGVPEAIVRDPYAVVHPAVVGAPVARALGRLLVEAAREEQDAIEAGVEHLQAPRRSPASRPRVEHLHLQELLLPGALPLGGHLLERQPRHLGGERVQSLLLGDERGADVDVHLHRIAQQEAAVALDLRSALVGSLRAPGRAREEAQALFLLDASVEQVAATVGPPCEEGAALRPRAPRLTVRSAGLAATGVLVHVHLAVVFPQVLDPMFEAVRGLLLDLLHPQARRLEASEEGEVRILWHALRILARRQLNNARAHAAALSSGRTCLLGALLILVVLPTAKGHPSAHAPLVGRHRRREGDAKHGTMFAGRKLSPYTVGPRGDVDQVGPDGPRGLVAGEAKPLVTGPTQKRPQHEPSIVADPGRGLVGAPNSVEGVCGGVEPPARGVEGGHWRPVVEAPRARDER